MGKRAQDVNALFRLRKWILSEGITVIHAHTTSYFFGTLIKWLCPKVQLVWHEHHGNRIHKHICKNKALWFCSFFFNAIITVNEDLKQWCQQNLRTKKVYNLPNFVEVNDFSESSKLEKVIVCVSNLRVPKNHLNLLSAFKEVHQHHPEWTLRLIGKDAGDAYSSEVKSFISNNNLQQAVAVLGAQGVIPFQLKHASIGVLSSDIEGLPMALLEYGAAGLAVVVTNVGDCEHVVGECGTVVPPHNSQALSQAIMKYIKNESLRKEHGANFRKRIANRFSLENLLKQVLEIYN
ncbi:MAG: glycosyltransferase [Flavobacteriaceae bacterium]